MLAAQVTTLVVACQGNGPQADRTNLLLCDFSLNGCAATPAPTDILYWVWPGTRRGDGTIEQALGPSGEVCLGPDQAGQQAVVAVPELTLADFRRLPLPAGDPTIQPGNGYTLINVATNVFVEAEPVILDTTLIGFPVQVRATPSRYAWQFGDGGSLGPTTDPGGPYPELSTTHTYEDPGQYAVTLTTFYTGEYSVDDGPWLPVDGEAQVDSDPVGVEALAGRNVLVDGTLRD